MTCSSSYETLRELIAGAIPLTHEALDAVDRGMSTIYFRAALVRHGALPERPAQTAALAAFIAGQLPPVPDGPDRLHLHAFATWKVQHDLSQAERRGPPGPSSHQVAQKNVRVATDLLCSPLRRGARGLRRRPQRRPRCPTGALAVLGRGGFRLECSCLGTSSSLAAVRSPGINQLDIG
jgi:hypothetical protein